jgi:hypothetical protein
MGNEIACEYNSRPSDQHDVLVRPLAAQGCDLRRKANDMYVLLTLVLT